MEREWIVIASQESARIIESATEKTRMLVVRELKNDIGRERETSLKRHMPGSVISGGSGGRGAGLGIRHHTYGGGAQTAHEDAALQFAKTISDFLNSERKRNSFDALVIAAEPKFLGKLRAAIPGDVECMVKKWIKKDLAKVSVHGLEKLMPTQKPKRELNLRR